MKIKRILVFLSLSWITLSCSNWLEVDPELEVYEETMFEKEQGYFMAVNGVYAMLSEQDLYGKELLYGAMEVWGRTYLLNEQYQPGYYALMNFDYENSYAQKYAEAIWQKCYKVIAETNNIIKNLEADTEIKFTGGEVTRNMIRGELYAVRALMHFEIIRIFAQAPVLDGGGVTATVPYVTDFPSRVNNPMPTKDILANILSDLKKAQEWVKDFDTDPDNPGYTICSASYTEEKLKPSTDFGKQLDETEFFRYRAHRLNYFAITHLLARVALYAGDKELAFEEANGLVEWLKKDKPCKFTLLGSMGDPVNKMPCEPKLQNEILFGGNNTKLSDWTEEVFWSTGDQGAHLNIKDKSAIFEDNSDDIRLKSIPGTKVTKFVIEGRDEETIAKWENLIPIFRIPETFLIAAEAVMDTDMEKAVEIYNYFVEKRGNEVYKFSTEALPNSHDFLEAVIKEYRREYIGEGQMVFVYKRLNIPIRDGSALVDHYGKLVLPVPDSETVLY